MWYFLKCLLLIDKGLCDVKTSDDFHSISFLPPLPVLYPLWWKFYKTLMCLYHVFTYIYSLLKEKEVCDHRNVTIKLPCVCVCLSPRDIFIFSVIVSSFFSYFLCHFYICITYFYICLYSGWRYLHYSTVRAILFFFILILVISKLRYFPFPLSSWL